MFCAIERDDDFYAKLSPKTDQVAADVIGGSAMAFHFV